MQMFCGVNDFCFFACLQHKWACYNALHQAWMCYNALHQPCFRNLFFIFCLIDFGDMYFEIEICWCDVAFSWFDCAMCLLQCIASSIDFVTMYCIKR